MNKWLACALVALTSGCPDIKTDADETSADPIVEFDPSNSIVPFPNNLLINPMTGKVNVPAGCNETASSKALREGVLNQLDGFGTFEVPMSVTLTKPIDMTSVADNIVLFKVTMDPSTSNPIPTLVLPGTSIRYANQTKNADGTVTCDTPNPIDSLTIVPRVPLEQKSTYIVAIKNGIKSADGEAFVASFTWSLVRQDTNPVTLDDQGNIVSDRTPLDPSTPQGLASLQGINLLWNAHAPVLQFLAAKQIDRNDTLLAWSFKTQTTQDPLIASVAGTPAAQVNRTTALTGPQTGAPVPVSIPGALITANAAARTVYPFLVCSTGAAGGAVPPELNDVQCFLKMALGGGTSCTDQTSCETSFTAGTRACGLLGCSNIGDLLAARVSSAQYQIDRPNAFDANKPIPGPWGDPVKPAKVRDELIHVLITIPAQAAPAAGWPVAIFQHGLGRGRTDLLAIGGQLAKVPTAGAPFATVAIDAVAHGDGLGPFPGRAVRNSDDPAKGCTGTVTAGTKPQCYAGFLSPDLGTTRDNIRQTTIDLQQLAASVKACGTTACGSLKVNADSMVYIGQSLGGTTGFTTFATTPELKAGVMNVPGVGWADIFENTETLAIRCTLVDGLIDAGTLTGAKRDTKGTPDESDDTGLCVGQEWKTQPGYRQFAAIGRWVLDPGDPANFAPALQMTMGTKKFLIQEVPGDKVIPNLTTMNAAALTGRTAATADPGTGLTPTPSAAITAAMPASKYVRYPSLPPNPGVFPGNTFSHGSLLSPAPSVVDPTMPCNPGTGAFCDGVLATARMVTDAIAFLHINK